MTGGGGMEVAYLKDTIGEALSEGCASTAIAAPGDPVEFLGKWLLKCVPTLEVWNRCSVNDVV
jgi:hypothetical protein